MGLFEQIAGIAVNTGAGILSTKMSTDKLPLLNKGVSIAQAFMKKGDITDALDSAVNSGLINDLVKRSSPYHKLMGDYLNSQLHARLPIKEVERITALAFAIEHARKNLFLVNISPYPVSVNSLLGNLSGAIGGVVGNKISGMLGGSRIANIAGKATSQLISSTINSIPILGSELSGANGGGITSMINMLATDLTYSLITLEGEQYNIGSSVVDAPKSGQPVDVTITTMDDEYGTIKRCFEKWATNTVRTDGTVGVMAERLLMIRILHAFVGDSTNLGGYDKTIIARPVGVEYDLSRREQAMEEFTMRFIQTDTFI
ncbi:hypothetical protein [Gallibacterium anatis]|uniref:hypothetical protein n=1 Tax=Gallibacterium anatis TaxID=750 RepID=UPI000531558E|nr:hypothetical protein [Gallibacterium anatis]KGQ44480.1 hypothetical protein JP29_09020 [Gallibacterium anatis]